MKDIVNKKIKEVISTATLIGVDEIDEHEALASLGIDSLSVVELIVILENTFNIIFSDADLDPEKLINVESISNLVINTINKK